jgi:predicted amidohydrolase YtcJ
MSRTEALKGGRNNFACRVVSYSHLNAASTGMTLDPAYASFSEEILGSISIGKRADYVVLSQDIMTIAPKKILETKVLATVIDGSVVYGSI